MSDELKRIADALERIAVALEFRRPEPEPQPADSNADVPINYLGDRPIEMKLRRLGVETVRDACRFSESELLEKPGWGHSSVRHLKRALERYDLYIRP
jgi:DNA-directed RNA polymerase alpha subunit